MSRHSDPPSTGQLIRDGVLIDCAFCDDVRPKDYAMSHWLEDQRTGRWCCVDCEYHGHSDDWT